MRIKGLPVTRIKIGIAKILYSLLNTFWIRNDKKVIVERHGIQYDLDLTEGIDLSIYLFGNFQRHITDSPKIHIPKDAVVLDVGGNFGIMALQFAKKALNGHVYSFEPTHYALEKFQRNLELNVGLADHVTLINSFVSSEIAEEADIQAFSSWKVDSTKSDKHPVHLGTAKSTENVGSITLDAFCERHKLGKVDFIKIDTDGHEFEVLQGARGLIAHFRPQIIFEIGEYVMEEKGIDFTFYLNYFGEYQYELYDAKNGRHIDLSNYRKHIPELGTIDIVAVPQDAH